MRKLGLNHVYRLVKSRKLGTWVVAAETANSHGKSSSRALIGALLLGILTLSPAAHAVIYTVDDGETVQDFVLNSGDEQRVLGGLVSGTSVSAGAHQAVNGGTVKDTALQGANSSQRITGGNVIDTVIDGGWQTVDGGTVTNVAVSNGGVQVLQGGTLEGDLSFNNSSRQEINSGTVDGAAFNNSMQILWNASGAVRNITLTNGSHQEIFAGTASDTILIDSNQKVSGGLVSGTRMTGSSSTQQIDGGTVVDSIISGGLQNISSGTVVDTILNDAHQAIGGDAVVENVTLNGGSTQTIFGGHTTNTTLNAGAVQYLMDGTTVNTTIHDGAMMDATFGGIASQVDQRAGGALAVHTGYSTVSGTNSFGAFSIDAATGKAENLLAENGGYLIAHANGTATSTKVLDGGILMVEDGGIVDGHTLIRGTGELYANQLLNNGVIEFDPNLNMALATSFSGAGSILKSGSGNLLLSGNTQQANGLHLTGGELGLGAGTTHSADSGPALRMSGSDAMRALVTGAQLSSSNSDLIVADGVSNASLIISDTSLSAASGKNLLQAMNNSQLDLDVSNTSLTGNLTYQAGSQGRINLAASQLTGQVQGGSLHLDSSSRWDMTSNSTVLDLVNSGVINFQPGTGFKTLTVDGDLSGSGFFEMNTDLSAPQGDLLRVRGQTTGSHVLLVRDSGFEPSAANQLTLVDGNGGNGSFSLYGGHVDAGAFRYTLQQRGDDWHLTTGTQAPPVDPVDPMGPTNPSKPPVDLKPGDLSGGANAAVASHSAAANLANAQMNSLVKRLGELRMGKDEGGLWTRAVGRTLEIEENSSRAFQQDIKGTELGADTAIDQASGKMYVGGMIGLYKSDSNFGEGVTGEADSKMLGAYATYIDDSGFYVDSVAKYSRIDNTVETPINLGGKAKGSYKTNGLGVGVEVGKRIDLEKGWFVEPQLELTATKTDGASYTMDNGLKVKADDTLSLQSRMGVLLGRSVVLDNGMNAQPYVKASYITEHGKDAQVEVNGHKLKSELPGSRVELGVGGVLQLSERSKISLDIEYAKGDGIEQPLGVTLGYRYLW